MTNKSNTIKELATALAKAQAQMQPAQMTATNPFLKNRYADLGSVIEAARGPLKANGLSVSQLPISGHLTVGVTTILMHESGEWIEETITLPLGDEKGKSQAQVAGSIISYLRRYSLAAVLGIYADEDTDGNTGNKPASAKKPEPERKPAAQPESKNGDAGKIGPTEFWSYVTEHKIERQIAADVAKEFNQDWAKAYDAIVSQHTPPSKHENFAHDGEIDPKTGMPFGDK